MNIYFAQKGLNSELIVFKARNDVSIPQNKKVIVKMVDGDWVVKIIDGPLKIYENIDINNSFSSFINSAEEKIIEHNYEYEQRYLEEIKNFIENNEIKMKILDVEMNFNRTKIIIYFESMNQYIDFKKLRSYFEEKLKAKIYFQSKKQISYCIEHNFTRDFAVVSSYLNLNKEQKILIQKDDGIWTGKVLRNNCKDSKQDNSIRIIGTINSDIQKILDYIKQKEIKAFDICKKEVEKEKLDMKLLKAEYNLSMKKIFFYYTADGRVDFRNLVKYLASALKKRIEMHQIGIRDELRTFPTIGICGQQTCCSRFLHKFDPIFLKMAKIQNLDITTEKITGVCNRLLCCLRYEYPTYYDYVNKINSTFPKKFKLKEDNITYQVVSFNPVSDIVVLLDLDNHTKRNIQFEELAKKEFEIIDGTKPFEGLNIISELDDKD